MILAITFLIVSAAFSDVKACGFDLDIFRDTVYTCQGYRLDYLSQEVDKLWDQYRNAAPNTDSETNEEIEMLVAENSKLMEQLSQTWTSVKEKQDVLLINATTVAEQAKQLKTEIDELNNNAVSMEEKISIQREKLRKQYNEAEKELKSKLAAAELKLKTYLQLYNSLPTAFKTNIDEFALHANDVVNSFYEKFEQIDLQAEINARSALSEDVKPVDLSVFIKRIEKLDEELDKENVELKEFVENAQQKTSEDISTITELNKNISKNIGKDNFFMKKTTAVENNLIDLVRAAKPQDVDEKLIKDAEALQKKLENIPFINATAIEIQANKATQKTEELSVKVLELDETVKEDGIKLNELITSLSA